MIIKELFNQVTFEELCPQLKSYVKTYDVFGNDLVKHLYRFREAYDRLRLLKPSGQLNSYIVKMLQNGVAVHKEVEVICYDDSDKVNINLSFDLEGSWEYNLSLELVLPKDKTISLAALAALCLWQLTYDNRSGYQEESSIHRALNPHKSSNKYEVALVRLENSIYKRQTPKLFLPKLKKYRLMRFTILPTGASNKMFNKFFKGDDRMNRSKRKRKYRQAKRKEFLKKMGNRQAFIDKFTMAGSSFTKGSCDYLLHVENGEMIRFRSPIIEHALDYIYTSMADYCVLPPVGKFKEAIAFVVFKKGQVVSSLEIDNFIKHVEELSLCRVIYGQAEGDVHETEVTLLMFNR
jgi:hypothetical protein